MSQRQLVAVIRRAIVDQEFRILMFADPDAAVTDYKLTELEVAALMSVDAESIDACANSVGCRALMGLSAKGVDSQDEI